MSKVFMLAKGGGAKGSGKGTGGSAPKSGGSRPTPPAGSGGYPSTTGKPSGDGRFNAPPK